MNLINIEESDMEIEDDLDQKVIEFLRLNADEFRRSISKNYFDNWKSLRKINTELNSLNG
jgi:hypothetical protein